MNDKELIEAFENAVKLYWRLSADNDSDAKIIVDSLRKELLKRISSNN